MDCTDDEIEILAEDSKIIKPNERGIFEAYIEPTRDSKLGTYALKTVLTGSSGATISTNFIYVKVI